MRLLLQNERKRGNAVNALLSLLVLGKRIIFKQPLKSRFRNNTYERHELRIGLVGVWMLEKLFD
jgi:hypothetical protein